MSDDGVSVPSDALIKTVRQLSKQYAIEGEYGEHWYGQDKQH